jgi:hypothetical protein
MYISVIDLNGRLFVTLVKKTIQMQAKSWGFKNDRGDAWLYLRSTTPITQDLFLVSRVDFLWKSFIHSVITTTCPTGLRPEPIKRSSYWHVSILLDYGHLQGIILPYCKRGKLLDRYFLFEMTRQKLYDIWVSHGDKVD